MEDEVRNVEFSTEETMESLMEAAGGFDDIHRGKVVEGTIIGTKEDGWLVDVGFKCEGFLSKREWSHRVLVEPEEEPSVGDKVRAQVISINQGEEAQLSLSRWRCEFDERWNKLEEQLEQNETVEVKGLRKVKGGLLVDCCGLEGFIPISHLAEEGRGVNPGSFVDHMFQAKVIEKDKRKRRFVLSRRSILEKELGAEREKFYDQVHEGDVLEGEVSSITTFGVFVNLGASIEGLVHITELSWQKNPRVKDLVNKGDKVKVKVIGIDQEKNRVSLSMKQIMNDPWDTVAERWAKGTETDGPVTNMTEFGAFVEIEPGIEGLIHIGDISWNRIKHPKEVLKRGQMVHVVILDIDTDRRRISLGYRQLNDPWKQIDGRYTKGQDVNVKVIRLAEFGAFVEVEPGIEGLIHISQLSRTHVEKPSDVLQAGQEMTARILEIDPVARRMRLSLKVLQPETEHSSPKQDRPQREPRQRREDGEFRHKERAPQIANEELSVTIADMLKQRED